MSVPCMRFRTECMLNIRNITAFRSIRNLDVSILTARNDSQISFRSLSSTSNEKSTSNTVVPGYRIVRTNIFCCRFTKF